MSDPHQTRRLKFSGTWYPAIKLNENLSKLLQNTKTKSDDKIVKAIITPHAGLSYSGQTQAYSYASINFNKITRLVLLGVPHHRHFYGVALPSVLYYHTPFCPSIKLDTSELSRLSMTRKFGSYSKEDDENEHSLELQLPFISHLLNGKDIKILPVYVGDIRIKSLKSLLEPFADLVRDPSTLFVISSDFCHYGDRFDFIPFEDKSDIAKCIEELDKEAIQLLCNVDITGFSNYLQRTRSTICGRNSILFYLNLLEYCFDNNHLPRGSVKGVELNYSRSCDKLSKGGSSVSYVAMKFVTIPVPQNAN